MPVVHAGQEMPATELGLLRLYKGASMSYSELARLPWWEQEKHLTEKDKTAISKAHSTPWEEINEDWAETELGRKRIHDIAFKKYQRDLYAAGMD